VNVAIAITRLLFAKAIVRTRFHETVARDDVQARRSARVAYPLPQRSERCPPDEPFASSLDADVARRRIPANTKTTAQLTEGKHTLAKPSQAGRHRSARARAEGDANADLSSLAYVRGEARRGLPVVPDRDVRPPWA
jgi:hypothetical protein